MKQVLLSILAGLIFVAPAGAADVNKLDGKVAVSEDAVNDAADLNATMEEIIADLSEANQKHFIGIYHTHALIGTVEAVRGDMERAVVSCAEENPDLAEELEAGFAGWTGAVNPVLDEAEGQIKNMVLVQDYRKPKELRALLKNMDDMRAKTAGSLDKVPVTTEKACKKLLKRMGRTQDDLVTLLQETLVDVLRSLSEKAEEPDVEAEAELEDSVEEPAQGE